MDAGSGLNADTRNMKTYHKHHIIPKHMGGTDDSSNLVEVTVEQHAALHKQLWEDLGYWQDYVAWKALSKQITSPEIRKQINEGISQSLKKKYNSGHVPWNKGKTGIYSEETKEKLRKAASTQMKSFSEDQKKHHSMKSGKNAKWYTNGYDEKWIKPEDDIPEGWKLGRKKFSSETRNKLKESHLEQIPWNKGLKKGEMV